MTTPEDMEKDGWEQVFFDAPRSPQEIYTSFHYWLYLDKNDEEVIDVVLAAALDRDILGDPLWIYIISPSGGVKTELVRSLNSYERIYTLDSLTPSTFISGKVEKDEDGEYYPVAGILDRIDGKVLIIKDFTVLLSSPEYIRTEIYGQLRAIHDGYFERGVGTLKEPIRVKAKIGLIAAVTPAIDMYTKAHNLLGERFLKVRLHPNSVETTRKSFKNLGKEEKMREKLATAVDYYLCHVRTRTAPDTLSHENELIKIARYIAMMRARVICRYKHGRVVDMNFTEPEVPTRVVKQLRKLLIGLAKVRQNSHVTEEDMATIKRVAP